MAIPSLGLFFHTDEDLVARAERYQRRYEAPKTEKKAPPPTPTPPPAPVTAPATTAQRAKSFAPTAAVFGGCSTGQPENGTIIVGCTREG